MTSSQAATTTEPDAVELLVNDHHEVEELFRRIESFPADDTMNELTGAVVRELSVHAVIEEQVLYPAVRRALPDGDALADEAIEDHQDVKETLAAVERAGAGVREELLVQLMTDVRHHVEEEEGELFPNLRAAVGDDELREMGAAMARAKKMAPTHPHPHAPNTPPGNVVGGAAAAVVDKVRDALRRD